MLIMVVFREQMIIQMICNYGDCFFCFIRGWVNLDVDVEDVLQDVWYQFSRMVDFSIVENINVWLYCVVCNCLIDCYCKKQFEVLEDLVFEGVDGEIFFLDDFFFFFDDIFEEVYFW